MKYPTQKYLLKFFNYDPKGFLIWKVSRGNNRLSGKIAGRNKSGRSAVIKLKGRCYSSHRLIFILLKGYLPKGIDHINRNSNDNRIQNLRPCTQTLNSFNTKLRSDNTSGYRGVYAVRNKWRAVIGFNKKKIQIGYFNTKRVAQTAYYKKAKKLAGEFFCP